MKMIKKLSIAALGLVSLNDDVLNLKQELILADKSLEDLKYEGDEFDRISFESKKSSSMIHKILEQVNNKTRLKD